MRFSEIAFPLSQCFTLKKNNMKNSVNYSDYSKAMKTRAAKEIKVLSEWIRNVSEYDDRLPVLTKHYFQAAKLKRNIL